MIKLTQEKKKCSIAVESFIEAAKTSESVIV